MRLEPLWG